MTEEIKAYCMKCKAERTIQSVQIVMTKNGRPAANGTCPVCGTKMFKFLPSSYKSQAIPAAVAPVVAEASAEVAPAASEPAPAAESAPASDAPAA